MANTWFLDYSNGSDLSPGTAFIGAPALKSGPTLSGGGLTATSAGVSFAESTAGIANYGASYFEVTIGTSANATNAVGLMLVGSTGAGLGGDTNSIGYRKDGSVRYNNAVVTTLATYTTGNTICVAVDTVNLMIYFRVGAGSWNNASADPVAGLGGISIAAAFRSSQPANGIGTVGDSCTFNFGASAYNQSPPAGYGNCVLAFATMAGVTAAANVLAGDTVRIAKSPDPTSLGQAATWTDANQAAFVTNKSLTGATNASPIACTTASIHGWVTGDYVTIGGAVGNLAANGQFQITVTGAQSFTLNGSTGSGPWSSGGTVKWWTNHAVTLTSAVTASIERCEAAWTNANSTTGTTTNTVYKEGTLCTNHVVPASAANTLYAYRALGSTIDYSAYQQISFWFRSSVALADNQRFRLCLCSDNAGATIVNSAPIPTISVANAWRPVTVNFGAALGSSIQSIALYSGASTMATVTINLDNIIACKASSAADSLSLTSVIGKNDGIDGWYAIQSIVGTTIMLDNDPATLANAGRGYSGTTTSATLYKRETTKTLITVSTVHVPTVTGTAIAPLTYDGGYDTASNTQTGDTYFDGQTGNGTCIGGSAMKFVTFNKLSFLRYSPAIAANTYSSCTFNIFNVSNCTGGAINFSNICGSNIININNANNSAISAMGFATSASNNIVTIYNCNSNTSAIANLQISGDSNKLYITNCKNGLGNGVSWNGNFAANNTFYNTVFSNNTGSSIQSGASYANVFKNCTFNDSTVVSNLNPYVNAKVYLHNYTPGVHKIYSDNGTISTDTSTTHTAGTSWNLAPTSTTLRNAAYPLDLTIAKVFCNAGTLVTAAAWFRRDNTSLTGKLAVRGGQLTGVASDVTATTAASANTWEQLTVTFTPTEAGVIEIQAWAYDGTNANTNLWVDDFTVSQL